MTVSACSAGSLPFRSADDVANGPPHSRRAIERVTVTSLERARLRREVAIDLVRRRIEIQPGAERALHHIARQIEHRKPVFLGLRLAQPSAEPLGRGPMIRVVDDQDGFGAVLSRHLDFAHHRRMHRVRLSFERAARVVFLRLVRENQHGFAGGVDARVVVIAQRRRGNPVAREHDGQRVARRRLIARGRHDLVVAARCRTAPSCGRTAA